MVEKIDNNELMTIQESTFVYDFKPAEIEIKNYDNLVEVSEQIAKHYDSLVFTNSTLAEINEAHRELNGFVKGLEESRLNVKREYNKPLNEFEGKIKSVVETLSVPLQTIKDARDEILEAEEETRAEALYDYLTRQLKGSIVRVEDIEIKDSWTNKGNWTEKFNPRKRLSDEIKREIEIVEEECKNELAQREVLEKFLESKQMDPDGWLEQLEYRNATEIMDSILRTEEKRKQEEKEKEEREQQVVEQPKSTAAPVEIDRMFEEIDEGPEPIVEQEIFTERIAVTGTREQLNALNDFMVANGIGVAPINEFDFNETIDDLPF